MKIASYTAYGGPETIAITEAPTPSPGMGEVVVRVRAAPVTAGDARLRSGRVPRGVGLLLRLAIGLRRPRVAPGIAFAGEVAGIGPGVTAFSPGQPVFGLTGFKGGAHREYLVMKANGTILPLPETLTFESGAAFFFGGLTAAEFLIDRAHLAPGERLLVAGATGAVGSAAVQIGCHLGATVSATASPANHPLARSLGAVEVTDYRKGPPPGPFDVIVDVMGSLGWQGARSLLAPGGRLVLITADLAQMLGSAIRPHRDGRRVLTGTNRDDLPAMQRLLALHQAGGYTPVLGPVLPFEKLSEAHAIAESFHKPGNIVVVMS
ncbi:NAD(P)-dependent alcohol dehydrogenase [Tabrizicola sp.]|uniref:NAD(P)-dependent alcohol dehydrogenase n=1 Tax=Tabrizicola sp. TaxID=2005166 RepID=UPI00261E5015|nr:NAD(P)-dependent alcohol dehydrogenase [Tabrizicola sp.]MDM7932129.1 NAD(P)-dependent alcohol dehydrogenase [Tabrizicola sp.]